MDERIKRMKKVVSNMPKKPGIYMIKDKEGTVIYVGKAILLKNRVSQYFNKTNKSARIEKMVSLAEDIEYIVTKNEVEALVLECNYIKNLNPKFNVMLKDDKTYPYIKININEKYPTINMTRRKLDDKALYFGPYPTVKSIKEVMNIIKEIFPLKRCKYNLEKTKVTPCLYYHIGRCIGPCRNDVEEADYMKMIDQIILFLNGKTKEIEKVIKEDISKHIEKLEFEEAEKLKQRLLDIEKVNLKQNVANLNEVSTDVIGYILCNDILYLQIFKIRGYKVIIHNNIKVENVESLDLNEILISCLSQYYNGLDDLPKKIYIKLDNQDVESLSSFLPNIQVIVPKIGEKYKLIQMVENNININIEESKTDVLSELRQLLNLDFETIESYDISNFRNDYIVGAMIRVDNGKLNKKLYRRFKIKSTLVQNDPKCIYEILSRRLKHTEWEYPDVIFIDGSINQITAAKKAVNEIGLEIPIYGMVKNSKHKTESLIDSNKNEIKIESKRILRFISFIQDEVHRFAIKYHRSLRDKMGE